jgi:hypothetical protein
MEIQCSAITHDTGNAMGGLLLTPRGSRRSSVSDKRTEFEERCYGESGIGTFSARREPTDDKQEVSSFAK